MKWAINQEDDYGEKYSHYGGIEILNQLGFETNSCWLLAVIARNFTEILVYDDSKSISLARIFIRDLK